MYIGTWTCARTLRGSDNGAAINAMCECRGRLATAGDDGVIKLWSCTTWTCEVTIHQTSFRSSSADGDDEVDDDRDDEGGGVGVMSLEVSDEKLISGGDDNIIRVWNTNSWTCERVIRAHDEEVWSLLMTPGGQLISGSVDATIRVWSTQVISPSLNSLSLSSSSVNLPSLLPSTSSSSSLNLGPAHFVTSQASAHHTRVSSSTLHHPTNLPYTHNTDVSTNHHSNMNNTDETSTVVEDWMCTQTIQSDGAIYALCCLDQGNLIVSAGSGSKISVWRYDIVY